METRPLVLDHVDTTSRVLGGKQEMNTFVSKPEDDIRGPRHRREIIPH